MESILQAAGEGLLLTLSWPNILYPIVGTLLAMIIAVLPGLSGVTLMVLAIPFTLGWDKIPTMLLFGAFVGGATFMGSVTSILLNIPGKSSNAATTIDGYPLAQKGEAKTALGCSAAASALGSTFGVLVLITLIPVMRKAILLLGPPELLMLAVWGLTTIAVVTQGSMLKGLAAAGIGLLLSFVGFDPRTAELRYTIDTLYLRDGLSFVPIFLGVFALAETIDLATSGRPTVSGKTRPEQLSGSVWRGIRSVFEHRGLFLRSSVIGTVIGMVPGIGGTVASFVAYGHAAQSGAGPNARFGHGDIRGVLAPEAANDAKDAGALVPTLAFGIPGGTGTAMLLGVLTMHGMAPGRALLGEHLSLVFALIWSLLLSNWLTSIVGLSIVSPLARLTVIRTERLVPVIIALATFGAFLYRGRLADVAVAFVFGVVGYAMKAYGWSRIPFVIAIVLGPVFEANFHITVRLESLGRIHFLARPITCTLIVLTLASVTWPLLQGAWARRRRET